MPHAIWNGSVNFGLVSIPVKLVAAVRADELRFHFLHDEDHGRIANVRTCELCGRLVEWQHVVRGFEVEKDRYVIVSDDDLRRVDVAATQSIDITQFVRAAEIDPMLFDRPYYLEPEKRAHRAYALLRETLAKTERVGIASVVLHTRQHPAAVRPQGRALVLEVMRFADEILDSGALDLPAAVKAGAPEMRSATMLVEAMSAAFDPQACEDTYRKRVLALVEARARGRRPALRRGKAAVKAAKVVDLRAVLKRSLARARRGRKRGARPSRVA